jgi:hypothetical protein
MSEGDPRSRGGGSRPRLQGERPLGELATRLIRAGAEAAHKTSEKIRERGEDLRARDLVQGAANLTLRGKEELMTLAAKEVRGYLEKLKLGEELREFLTQHSLEVSASIRLKPLLEKQGAAGRGGEDAARAPSGSEPAGPGAQGAHAAHGVHDGDDEEEEDGTG